MNSFSFEQIGTIAKGQDGAIFNDLIFRFDHKGNCNVFKLNNLEKYSRFSLDNLDFYTPHSNSVCFGNKISSQDEFPLLYTNVYNTYKNEVDRREGTCLVYKITRNGEEFNSKLLQIIKVAFTKSPLWTSNNIQDVRPYGNFVVDSKNNKLYAFTMRDEDRKTRVFEFNLPSVQNANQLEPQTVLLNESDVISYFDCDYSNFIQGAIFYDNKILSVEGFTNSETNLPAIRVFDVINKTQTLKVELTKYNLTVEPEFIEVYNGEIYYGDNEGNFYKITLNI